MKVMRVRALLSTIAALLRSRTVQNVLKGTISLLLGCILIFISGSKDILRPTVCSNTLIAIVINTSATTVGAYRNGALRATLGILVGAVSWTLIGLMNGSTYGYGAFVFVTIYCLNYIRAADAKYYPATLIASIMSFQGVYYSFTTTAGQFNADNQTQLLHTMCAFASGVAINWIVNLFILPEFAEVSLKELIGANLTGAAILVDLTTRTYLLTTTLDENSTREREVKRIRETLDTISDKIAEASAESSYSQLGIEEYSQIKDHLRTIGQHLSAIDASLKLHSLITSPGYEQTFALPLKDALNTLSGSIQKSLIGTRDRLMGFGPTTSLQRRISKRSAQSVSLLEHGDHHQIPLDDLDAGYRRFEDIQYRIMYGLFEPTNSNTDNFLPSESVLLEEEEVSFCTVAVPVFRCRTCSFFSPFARLRHSDNDSVITSFGDEPQQPAASRSKRHKSALSKYFQTKTVEFLKQLKSSESVFGLKVAVAISLLCIVLFSQSPFFETWNLPMSGTVGVLVAISPNVGQTYATVVVNLTGNIFGLLWALFSLTIWTDSDNVYNPYGLGFFTVLLAIPFSYVAQNYKTIKPVGVLALFSFSNAMTLSYLYRFNGPDGLPYAAPAVRFYHQLAITSMSIGFAGLLSVVILPNLARRVLREEISAIIARIDQFYTELVSLTYLVLPGRVAKEVANETGLREQMLSNVTRIQASLPDMFSRLATLQEYAKVEPRLEGLFESEQYAALISTLSSIVDRLISARCACGDKPFVAMSYTSAEVQKARFDFQSTTRLLLYLFASTLSYKQPLPPSLPSCEKSRHALFGTFIRTALSKSGPQNREIQTSRDFIRFYSWAICMKNVAKEIDCLGVILSALFGTMPDDYCHLLLNDSADSDLDEDAVETAKAYTAIVDNSYRP
ncbi:hypothetical protein SmJEL517_g04795 [Synchytrium microbalum]|uniref:Uncharacterized protein n=1 Tax=Synchytrium microbalum TaxID=1806994 RepID=A0A507BPY5_9FUNG|nr:uncharacterized protein SmJEL517_g04795 [Synchytrium microbalum]TPX31970.1 hypothetical protein SmJEL517_g04795 [Synchytrium microbalum]